VTAWCQEGRIWDIKELLLNRTIIKHNMGSRVVGLAVLIVPLFVLHYGLHGGNQQNKAYGNRGPIPAMGVVVPFNVLTHAFSTLAIAAFVTTACEFCLQSNSTLQLYLACCMLVM